MLPRQRIPGTVPRLPGGRSYMKRTIRIIGIMLLHLAIGLYLIAILASGVPKSSGVSAGMQPPYRQSTANKR